LARYDRLERGRGEVIIIPPKVKRILFNVIGVYEYEVVLLPKN
jgi:hypothetical protein